MGENFEHRSFLVVDVAGFGGRSDRFQLQIRRGLTRLLEQAFDDAGIVLDDCAVEDRGDGKIVLVPSTVSKMKLVDPLLARLAVQVQQYNDMSSDHGRIRLRAALHAGEVARDAGGWSGTELNTVFRLVNSTGLREVEAEHLDAPFIAVVSNLIYSTVVRHGHGAVRPEEYRKIEVVEKELVDVAWVHVPGRGGNARPDHPVAPERPAPAGATPAETRSGGINFLGATTVLGDAVGRDKYTGTA